MQGVGMAACPRSRHSFKSFVRTGDDAAGSKNRSYAQVVSRTQRIRAVIAIGCRKDRDNDWCSDACQKLWPRRLVMQAFDKPSPKQPLGQRREFIPRRRLAAQLRGRRQ
jgi:hypothetical protein